MASPLTDDSVTVVRGYSDETPFVAVLPARIDKVLTCSDPDGPDERIYVNLSVSDLVDLVTAGADALAALDAMAELRRVIAITDYGTDGLRSTVRRLMSEPDPTADYHARMQAARVKRDAATGYSR